MSAQPPDVQAAGPAGPRELATEAGGRPPAAPSRLYTAILAVGGLAVAIRLGHGIKRLLFPSHVWDSGDLRMRWDEVQAWFQGQPVYGAITSADYPPGSYPMFWPFVGWADFAVVRWLWAALTVVLAAWLARRLTRESDAPKGALRAALLLAPLGGYATYAILANGQVSILVLAALTGGTLMVARQTRWPTDVAGSSLVALSLIKPTLAVPVVWVAFLKPQRWRPFLLVVGGYLALTLLAVQFQPAGLLELMRGWLGQSANIELLATRWSLQRLMVTTGLEAFYLPAGIAVIIATGVWVWRYRSVDVWVLLGVTSIVAMLLTYHRPYDDVFLLLPLIALVRIASRAERPERLLAAVLAWALLLMAIEHPQFIRPRRTHGLYVTEIDILVFGLNNVRLALWLGTLAFLARAAHRATRAAGALADAAGGLRTDVSGAGGAPVRAQAEHGAPGSAPWPRLRPACMAWVLGVLALSIAMLVSNGGEDVRSALAGVLAPDRLLREIPTALALALFLLAARAGAHSSEAAPVRIGPAAAALLAAGALMAAALLAVVLESGPGMAARNLLQLYARPGEAAYGSHWRLQLLSTLWFGLTAPVALRLAHVPAAASIRSPFGLAVWLYFGLVTVVFGLGVEPLADPYYIRHQLLEILMHIVLTLPLGMALLGSAGPPSAGTRQPSRGRQIAHTLAIIAIPLALGIALVVDGAGSVGPSAINLVAWHLAGHTLTLALVALLVVGLPLFSRPLGRVATRRARP